MKNVFKMTSARIISLGFLAAIIVGTIALSLPFATASGKSCGILDSLFTATTSVCVTGLVVADTFSFWSLFGKIVILILIQIGGLGIVSITTMFMMLFRRRLSFKNTMLIQDAFNLNTRQGLKKFVSRVISGTFIIEGIGTILYSFAFVPQYGAKGLWYALFNSVSAFCNAGMDILGSGSLMSYNSNPLVLITTAVLIILGGLGFVVWWDILEIIEKLKKKKISFRMVGNSMKLQTKIVLVMTVILLVTGTALIFIFERNNPLTIGNLSTGDKVLNSFFQSVTLRTAGFSSFSQKGLENHTALFSMVLMFIGGSPVGTAGGIKTVTFAVCFFTFLSMIQEKEEIVVMKKKIPDVMVKKSVTIVFISLGLVIIFSVLLMLTNDVDFVDGIYEVVSAIATVGLSRDLTSSLNTCGKLIIICCMYLGRIGPISMAVAFYSKDSRKNLIHYPEGEVIVG